MRFEAKGVIAMIHRLLAAGWCLILILGGVSFGQVSEQVINGKVTVHVGADQFKKMQAEARKDVDSGYLLLDSLKKAQVSASLEYSGRCDRDRQLPEFPNIHAPVGDGNGPALQIFREMLSDEPEIEVTQEADGTIRMIEKNIPYDFLNVKIKHISFKLTTNTNNLLFPYANKEFIDPNIYEPENALELIQRAPEVESFMKAQDIGWPPSPRLGGLIHIPSHDGPHMSGDLDNVTVSQALDHVLKTFPGFWVYENCPINPILSVSTRREVFIKFFTYYSKTHSSTGTSR